MAKRGRFVINSKGFRDALTSGEIQSELTGIAEAAANRANTAMGGPGPQEEYGFRATTRPNPRSRAAAYVRTGGGKSKAHNAKYNTLLKSIGG